MRNLLDDEAFHEETPPTQGLPFRGSHENFDIFPMTNFSFEESQPDWSPNEREMLWTTYESNVTPLVRIFHHPSLETLYKDPSGFHRCSSRMNTVFCAVEFVAVVSLTPDDCEVKFGQTKAQLLHRSRSAAELAFNETGLLNSNSLLVLQAFVLYLTSMRRCDETWLVLSWTGLAIRIGMNLGIHRDGSDLGLDTFSTEIRRRLWWHLLLLDADLSEAHGVDPLLRDVAYNTQMPTNLDDVDLRPGMATPKPRMGFTDMTPSITRYVVMLASRKLKRQRESFENSFALTSDLENETKTINEVERLLQERYLRHCSERIPLQWSTQQIVQMKCKMMHFCVCHVLGGNGGTGQAQGDAAMHDRLFALAIDVAETVHNLQTNPTTCQWSWQFRTDTQWPVMVYLLNEVIQRPASPAVDKVWSIIKKTRHLYQGGSMLPGGAQGARGMLFRPMRELTAKAFVIKDAERQQEVDQDCIGGIHEAVNGGIGEPRGLPQLDHPSEGFRLPGHDVDFSESWQADQLSAFQEFWRIPMPDELDSSLYVGEQSYENLLL